MPKSLSRVIFYIILLISFFSVFIIEGFNLFYEYNNFQKNSKELKEDFISHQKEIIKIEVSKAIDLIDFDYDLSVKNTEKDIKARVYEAYEITKNIYERNKNTKSKEEIISLIKQTLRSVRFFDSFGYYFIFDLDGKNILHPIFPKNENSYKLKNFTDLNGNKPVKRIIEIAKKQKEGYFDWTFYRPDNKKVQGKKRGFVKLFEPYNFAIVTADYLYRLENILKKQSLQRIRQIKLENNGYFFIMNNKGEFLINRNFKNFENKSLDSLPTQIKDILLTISKKIENKNNIYLKYSWTDLNTKENIKKLSYIQKYNKWDWIIGTGVNLNQLNLLIDEKNKKLKDKLFYRLVYSALFLFLLLLLIILVSKKVSKQLDSSFLLFINFFKRAKKHNEKIDYNFTTFKEFRQLADYANEMVEKRIKDEELLAKKNKEILESMSLLNEYKKAVDVSTIVSKTNKEGIITYVNDEFCKISEYSKEELLGNNHSLIKDINSSKDGYLLMWKTILSKRVWKGILKNRTKSGKSYYVKSTIVPILDLKGEIKEFIALRHDVTDLIEQEKRIKHQTTDYLTKLPNRQSLLEEISEEQSNDITLAVINIVRFKEVNEYYGYKIGDKLLIEISKIIDSFTKAAGVKLYKLHGDEFAILLKSKEKYVHFLDFISLVLKYFKNNNILVESNSLDINLVIGVSSEENHYLNAEIAKNHAKDTSCDIVIFEENKEIKDTIINNVNWTNKLKDAIKENRIALFIQAIVPNDNTNIQKYECLVRLIEKDGSVVSPFYFLNIAKKAKLYTKLTKIVIKKAFNYFEDKKDVNFSINLTIEDILDDDVVNYLKNELNNHKSIANRLVLEIVEDEGIENYNEVVKFIENMKELGCKIAIDDFGTGYSNFDYLMKLNVDFVKIDGSMIRNINNDENAKIVTKLIVNFSKQLGIKTIAEFVHSKEVFEEVKNMNIDFSQGFYLGEPFNIDDTK